jgi:tRNA A37 methylthiotransferase MiaB
LNEAFQNNIKSKFQNYIGTKQLVLIDKIKNYNKIGTQFSGKQDDFRTVVIDYQEGLSIQEGDYIKVEIVEIRGQTLVGKFISKSSIKEFHSEN